MADTGGNINEYNGTTGAHIKTFATGLLAIGGITLSQDGSILYAAAQSFSLPGFGTYAFNTTSGTLVHSALTDAAHDVRVGPDGRVYASDPFAPTGPGGPSGTGVLVFSADLGTSATFVPRSAISNPSGMTFDKNRKSLGIQFRRLAERSFRTTSLVWKFWRLRRR